MHLATTRQWSTHLLNERILLKLNQTLVKHSSILHVVGGSVSLVLVLVFNKSTDFTATELIITRNSTNVFFSNPTDCQICLFVLYFENALKCELFGHALKTTCLRTS